MELDSTQTNVAAALEDALSYIQEHGWCQKNYENYAGQVCAMGAVYKVADPLDHDASVISNYISNYENLLTTKCRKALEHVMGEPPGHYNDTHTQAEVEDKFREAIALDDV